MKKYCVIGDGENCPKCNKPMQRREHSNISTKLLKKPYYFSEWDYCKPCGHIQHYESKKVLNNNKKSIAYKKQEVDFKEYNKNLDFIRSI